MIQELHEGVRSSLIRNHTPVHVFYVRKHVQTHAPWTSSGELSSQRPLLRDAEPCLSLGSAQTDPFIQLKHKTGT